MGTPRTATLTLPPEPESAGRARRFLRARLDGNGHDDLVDAATLLVSEIVTNVVLHAPTWLEVRVSSTDTGVRVDVLDGSAVAPAHRDYDGYASTGHGLSLVAYLAADYGVDLLDDGKSVWFTLETTADQPLTESADPSSPEWPVTEATALQTGPTTPVVLPGLPVRLWTAARQHHEAALRELYLHQAMRDDSSPATRSRAQAQEALAVMDRALDAALAARDDEPRGAGPSRVDVSVEATADLVAGLLVLQATLDEAERLAHDGQLLVLPSLPEIVAVRDWCCDQVVAQVNGVAPQPWSEAFGTERAVSRGPVEGWDASVVLDSMRAVIAGDDTNRVLAVSAPAAALVGWEPDDLVGRRVVDLVPPSLREAHVAGFTRHQTTGVSHVLGHQVEMPVLRSDGTEVPCSFLLERVPAPGGRSVYLVWLDPLG